VKHRRLHNVVAAVLVVLTTLTISFTVLAVWAHQTTLNTDRFVGLVSKATNDPVVIDSLSQKLANQIVTGLDVQTRLQNILPDIADRFAAPLTEGITDRLRTAIANVLGNPQFHDTLESLIAGAHEKLLAVLRGDTPNVQIANGVVTIDLVSLASSALIELQNDGVLPADITIPTPEPFASHEEQVARINAALGTNLQPDFGQVELTRGGQGLNAGAIIVRAFDATTIGLLVASAILGVITVWFADRRWRAVLAIVVGISIVSALLMLFLGAVSSRAADTVASPEGHVLIASIIRTLAQSLFLWLVIVAITALFIGGAAVMLGGRDRGSAPAQNV